jgi:hypothetical protein
VKIDKWTIETAQTKHTARKYTMTGVVDAFLRKQAAIAGIEDYKKFLKSAQDDPSLYDAMTEQEREFHDIASMAGMWVMFAACIVPYLPLAEWLALPFETLEKITDGVMAVNPHWFEQPDQEKKTEPQPPQSTNE